MAREVGEFLKVRTGMTVVDGTVGEGGHACMLARSVSPDGVLIGIDRDHENLKIAKKRLESEDVRFVLYHGSYAMVREFLKEAGADRADGILLDLGFSSRHIHQAERGFSFSDEGLLDMRYDTSSGQPAHEWLAGADVREIARVLKAYGEEGAAAAIAREIKKVASREVVTAKKLSEAVSRAVSGRPRKHPATRTFQAIRIYVNRELEELEAGLERCLYSLREGGRLAVLTYHSLEDRIVKRFFDDRTGKCKCPSGVPVCVCDYPDSSPVVRIPHRSGLRPGDDEIRDNPSARSARMRGCVVLRAADR